jgi:hypothetical protein
MDPEDGGTMSAQSDGPEPPRPLRVSDTKGYSPHGWKEEDSEVFVVHASGEVTPAPRERQTRREPPAADPLAGLRKQVRARAQERSGDPEVPTSVTTWVVGAIGLSLIALVFVAIWLAF